MGCCEGKERAGADNATAPVRPPRNVLIEERSKNKARVNNPPSPKRILSGGAASTASTNGNTKSEPSTVSQPCAATAAAHAPPKAAVTKQAASAAASRSPPATPAKAKPAAAATPTPTAPAPASAPPKESNTVRSTGVVQNVSHSPAVHSSAPTPQPQSPLQPADNPALAASVTSTTTAASSTAKPAPKLPRKRPASSSKRKSQALGQTAASDSSSRMDPLDPRSRSSAQKQRPVQPLPISTAGTDPVASSVPHAVIKPSRQPLNPTTLHQLQQSIDLTPLPTGGCSPLLQQQQQLQQRSVPPIPLTEHAAVMQILAAGGGGAGTPPLPPPPASQQTAGCAACGGASPGEYDLHPGGGVASNNNNTGVCCGLSCTGKTFASDDTFALITNEVASPRPQDGATGAATAAAGEQQQQQGRRKGTPSEVSSPRSWIGSASSRRPTGQWKKTNILLGRGQFGSVYKAVDVYGFVFAVKLVDARNLDDVDTFKTELDALRRLNDRNVVKCFGCTYDAHHSQLNILMELCPYGTLLDEIRLTECGRLSVEHIRSYTRQILAGLRYLHGNGVVHCDVKGANVLLGYARVVKLADFGYTDSRYAQEMRLSHIGSPAWLAPEVVLEPEAERHPKSDIWSVGCTVIEMLGNRPWKVAEPFAICFRIADTTGPPDGIPENLPTDLEDMMLRCFERRLGDRPDANDLLSDEFFLPPISPAPPGFSDAATANNDAAVAAAAASGAAGLKKDGGIVVACKPGEGEAEIEDDDVPLLDGGDSCSSTSYPHTPLGGTC
eukprot:Rhum_TRINITY_DN14516_c19_g1::Rhum_TRINITY_DN14516_c19_g1_i1::g.94635::m.94635